MSFVLHCCEISHLLKKIVVVHSLTDKNPQHHTAAGSTCLDVTVLCLCFTNLTIIIIFFLLNYSSRIQTQGGNNCKYFSASEKVCQSQFVSCSHLIAAQWLSSCRALSTIITAWTPPFPPKVTNTFLSRQLFHYTAFSILESRSRPFAAYIFLGLLILPKYI